MYLTVAAIAGYFAIHTLVIFLNYYQYYLDFINKTGAAENHCHLFS